MSKKTLDNKFTLAQLIEKVSEQVRLAHREALDKCHNNPDLATMLFKEAEVEIGFDIDLEVGGKAGFFDFIKIGSKGTQSHSNKIKIIYAANTKNTLVAKVSGVKSGSKTSKRTKGNATGTLVDGGDTAG